MTILTQKLNPLKAMSVAPCIHQLLRPRASRLLGKRDIDQGNRKHLESAMGRYSIS
jgi:hypothetical protein